MAVRIGLNRVKSITELLYDNRVPVQDEILDTLRQSHGPGGNKQTDVTVIDDGKLTSAP